MPAEHKVGDRVSAAVKTRSGGETKYEGTIDNIHRGVKGAFFAVKTAEGRVVKVRAGTITPIS